MDSEKIREGIAVERLSWKGLFIAGRLTQTTHSKRNRLRFPVQITEINLALRSAKKLLASERDNGMSHTPLGWQWKWQIHASGAFL